MSKKKKKKIKFLILSVCLTVIFVSSFHELPRTCWTDIVTVAKSVKERNITVSWESPSDIILYSRQLATIIQLNTALSIITVMVQDHTKLPDEKALYCFLLAVSSHQQIMLSQSPPSWNRK